ncbi:G-protein coupled receptor 39 [Xenopus laevis]|uniref:G-protein coupled receptors family 1 profile domain-containing protein n=2 Tax=Xenopus laevis TaxID=8355 RepID=A0A974H3M2_XENLA|nr:G-protein coupled receptor 39 [Xenopus laevis]OCT63211.1 hypothetical protein XELAEV_18044309mg [Xenopus laevis]
MDVTETDPCDLIDHSHVPDFEVRLAVKITLTVLYAFILLAGVLGNSLTIKTSKVLRDKGYLQKGVTDHMISLACSDLLVLLLGMPVELYSVIWFPLSSNYGNITCKIYCFLFEACSYATIFHVATLSFERFVAICYPFRFKVISGSRVVKLMIGFAWITSLCVALPLIFAMGAEYPLNPSEGHKRHRICNQTALHTPRQNATLCTNLSNRWVVFQSSMFSSFIIYILVLCSVAFMCRKMMLTIMATQKGTVVVRGKNKTSMASEMTKSSSPEAQTARKQTIVFLGLIVGTLALCWMPNQVLRIMAASTPKYEWSVKYFHIYMTLLPVADTFFYLSSVVNPLLYNISSKQFRAVFLQVLRCHLTIEHVNKERLLRAQQISAKNNASSKRPLILMSIRGSLSGRKTKEKTFNNFQAAGASDMPLSSQEASWTEKEMKVESSGSKTSRPNGLCESEI